jgi:3-isopropylmalate/(R)-2-methylmalate dehydratase small subunit
MVMYGTTHRIGNDIDCDAILAPELVDGDPAQLAAACLAAVDPLLAELVRPGDILVAGAQFGGGAEPELAVLALQAVGFAAVMCSSVAPQFVQDAELYGLPVLVCPAAAQAIGAGSVVRIDLATGRIDDRVVGATYWTTPSTPELVQVVKQAQLLGRMRLVVEEEGFDG